ncbi:MAG: repeat protein [Edaphobacter sp.]|nr:repeat protein [Edaphobacter sp.]
MKHNLIIALILSASAIFAQQPKVSNTQFNSEPVGSGLSATVTRFQRTNQPLWIGYEILALPRTHHSSCSDSTGSSQGEDECCGEYQLEDARDRVNNSEQVTQPASSMYVLLRLDHGAIIKVRPATPGCRLNAGGVPFEWITNVQPNDSVSFLSKLAVQSVESHNQDNHVTDAALVTLSTHAAPAATDALASLAATSTSPRLREKAAFWLGAQRGHEGYLALQQLVSKEQDAKLREKLAFDLSINSDPAAIDEILKMAKSDSDSRVRSQALFWLAQKAGKKATAALKDAIESDPDTAVKKKAVFALSQLPKDEGIPQLVHVADTNTNPTVRKEAIFWLGQSNDPRALQYLEAVLKR